jgi:hypothetical protein
MPEDIDKKKYGFWRLETLPIIPEKFGLKPIADSKDRLICPEEASGPKGRRSGDQRL